MTNERNMNDAGDDRAPAPLGGRALASRVRTAWRLAGLLVLAPVAAGSLALLVSSALAQASPGGGSKKPKTCDNSILEGDHGFSFSGTFTGGVPFTGVGSESCDDTGHCTGVTTINIDGASSVAPFTADYTIAADCTGVETATYYTIGLTIQEAVTIVDGGKEVHFMGTDPDGTSLGVMKRR